MTTFMVFFSQAKSPPGVDLDRGGAVVGVHAGGGDVVARRSRVGGLVAVEAGAGLVVRLEQVDAGALGEGAARHVGRPVEGVVHRVAAFALGDAAGVERVGIAERQREDGRDGELEELHLLSPLRLNCGAASDCQDPREHHSRAEALCSRCATPSAHPPSSNPLDLGPMGRGRVTGAWCRSPTYWVKSPDRRAHPHPCPGSPEVVGRCKRMCVGDRRGTAIRERREPSPRRRSHPSSRTGRRTPSRRPRRCPPGPRCCLVSGRGSRIPSPSGSPCRRPGPPT